MKKTNYLIENFKNIQDLIKFVDQKAAVLLVVCGLLLTIFIETSKNLVLIEVFQNNNGVSFFWNIVTLILGVFFIVLLVLIFYICVFSILRPKFAENYKNEEFSSFYFEHIAKMDIITLNDKISELTEEKISKELTNQIYEISKILLNKSKKCAFAMKILFCSIVLLFLFIFSIRML